jgi:hypothetical protein
MNDAHSIHRVTGLRQVDEFVLRLGFEDGTEQTIDFQPVLAGEIYGPLADPALFARVRLDPESHTIVWPNGADFDPAQLHDWPSLSAGFERLAHSWALQHIHT